MKATSTRLEVFVKLIPKEFSELENSSLNGELKIYNDPSPPRNIPIEIEYVSEQRELLLVEITPEGDFCDADKVKFKVNSDYYNFVKSNGGFVDRFFTAGKLTLIIERRYSPY